MYRIKYYYKTGNSYDSEDREDILEYEWENLDIAKECLKRIKEHYEWYESIEHSWKDEVIKPKWHNIDLRRRNKKAEHNLINIPMDNGKEIQFWPPWVGYFELLYSAEIVVRYDSFTL